MGNLPKIITTEGGLQSVSENKIEDNQDGTENTEGAHSSGRILQDSPWSLGLTTNNFNSPQTEQNIRQDQIFSFRI